MTADQVTGALPGGKEPSAAPTWQQVTLLSGLQTISPAGISVAQAEGTVLPDSASEGKDPCRSRGRISAASPTLSCVFVRCVWAGRSPQASLPAKKGVNMLAFTRKKKGAGVVTHIIHTGSIIQQRSAGRGKDQD